MGFLLYLFHTDLATDSRGLFISNRHGMSGSAWTYNQEQAATFSGEITQRFVSYDLAVVFDHFRRHKDLMR